MMWTRLDFYLLFYFNFNLFDIVLPTSLLFWVSECLSIVCNTTGLDNIFKHTKERFFNVYRNDISDACKLASHYFLIFSG